MLKHKLLTLKNTKFSISHLLFVFLFSLGINTYAIGPMNLALASTAAGQISIPDSEINYPGASITNPFIAMEPYIVNIQGVNTPIDLYGAPRRFDYSGNVPFINPDSGKADPGQMQAWDATFAASFDPPLSGDFNLNGNNITNAGFPGRIEKNDFNGEPTTMVRYNAGDGLTIGTPRSKLNSYSIPSRIHARWELNVAFGKADSVNDWVMTPTTQWVQDDDNNWVTSQGSCPVLFWQIHSLNQSNPPLGAGVDTDELDASKLAITFGQRVGTDSISTELVRVHGIPKHTLIPIVIEAFLDERSSKKKGKGILKIWVNNELVVEKVGPTLSLGKNPHWWSIDSYLWNQDRPYAHNRSMFFKTAKMFVYPPNSNAQDTTLPSAPLNLKTEVVEAKKVSLSWNAATDDIGVTGYKIYRDDTEIGTTIDTTYIDTSVTEDTTYKYTVKAYDAQDNISAPSNIVTVVTPKTIKISSYSSTVVTNSATFDWITNVPSTGVVYYATSSARFDTLAFSRTINTLSTQHTLTLKNLKKNRKYYFKIVAKDENNTNASTSLSNYTTYD